MRDTYIRSKFSAVPNDWLLRALIWVKKGFASVSLVLISGAICTIASISNARAGDNFSGTVLTGSSGTVNSSTSGTSGETGEPPGFGGGALNSVWYSWTAPANGIARFATCNLSSETTTNFDSTLNVYTGNTLTALTELTSNDDVVGCNTTVSPDFGSWVEFNVTAGATYRIRVEGYADTSGAFVMRWGLNGFQINVTDNSATEGGGTAAVTVRPLSPPQGSTAIIIDLGANSQCSFAPTQLNFTASNFTTPQTIVVTAINDDVAEGTHSCTPTAVTFTNYGGVSGVPPTFTITDDDFPAFVISKVASVSSIGAPGTINYTITVDNTGTSLLSGTSLTDTLRLNGTAIALTSAPALISGDTNNNAILDEPETWVYAASYAVTQANIDGSGNLANTATFDTAETSPQTSNTATTTIVRTPAMTIDKSYVISTDGGTRGIADVGDVISYTYSVTNVGNVTINNVTIADVHEGVGGLGTISPPSVATLPPGATANFTANYVTAQGDIDNQ